MDSNDNPKELVDDVETPYDGMRLHHHASLSTSPNLTTTYPLPRNVQIPSLVLIFKIGSTIMPMGATALGSSKLL